MTSVQLGRLRLSTLDDGTMPYPGKAFFRNVPEAAWRATLDADAQGCISVGHNYALIEGAGACVLVDSGYGSDTHGGKTGHLLEELARAGKRRDEITHVVTTHGHGDHVKGNTLVDGDERIAAFPRARYLLARADYDWFGGPRHSREFDEHIATLGQWRMLDLTEGEVQVTREVLVIPTPGHTPGHASVIVESEGRTAIVLGDLCHLPIHVAHPDWVSEFDTDPQRTPETRAQLFDFADEHDALIVCTHAASPGLGAIRRVRADRYVWVTSKQAINGTEL